MSATKEIQEAFSKLKPGDRVLLRLQFERPLPEETFEKLRQNLSNLGVSGEIEETMTVPDYISIRFEIPMTVGFIWWIIPALLATGATGWWVWKTSKEAEKAAATLTSLMLPAVLIGGGLLIIAMTFKS